jgi:hypothetical protein
VSGVRLLLTATLLAVAGLSLGGAAESLAGQQESTFPHEAHQGLFPLCTGCHEGVPAGAVADYYPEPTSCSGCHDGVREVLVTWQGPTERIDNVSFEHQEHAAELAAAGDPAQDCAACHIPAGGGRLSVSDSVQLGTCWSCHAHEAREHEVDADCTTCHVPLGQTRFDVARIESLPMPALSWTASMVVWSWRAPGAARHATHRRDARRATWMRSAT